MTAHVVEVDLGIHEIAVEVFVVDLPAFEFLRKLQPRLIEIDGRHERARPNGDWRLPLEGLLLQGGGPATRRLSEIALQHVDDRFRKGHIDVRILDICACQPLRHHHQRHVADDLRGWCHLHDVAKHQVRLGVGFGHLMPARFEPHAACLGLQVGELATGHLVQIDFRSRRLDAALEGGILVANTLPVVGDDADRTGIESRVALSVCQSFDNRTETGLRCAAGEGIHGRIDRIGTCFGRCQNARCRNAAGVMRVEMNGQADFVFQCLHQTARCGRLQQTRHVLETQHMGTGGLQLPCHADIVLEVVLGAVRIEDIAGVADRGLADAVRIQHRVHGDAHVVDPVKAVKYAEHVDAGLRGLCNEGFHHIVRIGRVADAVGAAQQHLQHQVRHGDPQIAQPLPRTLLQETIGNVECCATPALDAEQA